MSSGQHLYKHSSAAPTFDWLVTFIQTSAAAGTAPGPNQHGVDDATGAASGPAPTALQTPAAAPRSDPTAGQATGDAGATGYPPDKRIAGAATTPPPPPPKVALVAVGQNETATSKLRPPQRRVITLRPRMVRVSNATLMFPSKGSMKEALVMGRQRTLRSAPATSRARRNMAAREPR